MNTTPVHRVERKRWSLSAGPPVARQEERHSPRGTPPALRPRTVVIIGLFLLSVPLWGSTSTIRLATEMVVFVVAFSGLHLLSGKLGLISVGHGAFIAIGAVGAAHAVNDFSMPYLLAPVAGAAAAAVFGLIIGVPSLRLPGVYLSLLTLAVAMVLPIGLRRLDGPLGYRVDGDIRPPGWSGLGDDRSDAWQYLLVLVVSVAIVAAVYRIVGARFERELIAVRDGPTAAAAFGIKVSRVHLTGVAISAALAGAAGGLRLWANPLVSGDAYPFSLSVAMFALMLALGASHLWTSVPAAVILIGLPEVLTRWDKPIWEPIVYATALLLMTRISRGHGLTSLWSRQ